MKKRYLILLVAIVSIGLTSCSQEDKNDAPESKDVAFHDAADYTLLAQANFTTDPTRYVAGKALLYKNSFHHLLRFEDFQVANGPELKVYLSAAADNLDNYIILGDLQAASGSFNYTFLTTTDVGFYKHVLVVKAGSDDIKCVAAL